MSCTCGKTFRLVEDYRDHLPCPGTPEQQALGVMRDIIAELLPYAQEAARKGNAAAERTASGAKAFLDGYDAGEQG